MKNANHNFTPDPNNDMLKVIASGLFIVGILLIKAKLGQP